MQNNSDASAAGDDQKRRAAIARRATAAFGQVMALIMRSPAHQRMSVAELRTVIAPIVMAGQFALAGRRFSEGGFVRPVAAVLWASVSAEADARLVASSATSLALKRGEISGGDIIWIVDVLGDGVAVQSLIDQLGSTKWKGRIVRARAIGPEKTVEVRTLGPFAAAS
ncbi:MAG: toxin-activating lysine-acyltransferase [Hyphomicrobiaceae bacterium]|nr:toxin-activating lysine-acyltransferase [Hyphomicrobiaceae bacterium]